MICYYCVIQAGLDPSYALLPQQAHEAEQPYAVPIKDYAQHCWVSHPRLAGIADDRLVAMATAEHRKQMLASARPHGRCATSRTCVEHAENKQIQSCKRGRGRRLP